MAKQYVLVTGASRGIGRSTALFFARKGCHVFLNCKSSLEELREVEASIRQEGKGSCTLVPADVGNPDEIRGMFDEIYRTCPCLDILINNAGVSHIGLLSDMSDSQWNRVIQTNLSSVFYCCRAAIPPMVSRKKGKIINISSMWGTNGASCEAAYSASKAGIHGLTQALARELAPSNVQVNALACGVIDTAMNSQLDASERKELEESIPMGRFGTPEETAEMIWNIANAPSYMTGQVIGIDGGY